MSFVKENSGNPSQVTSQFFQLARRLRADENPLAPMHGVPEIATVLGHPARQRIGRTIFLDLCGGASRVQHHAQFVRIQERERLHARYRRARKAEDATVDHSIDVQYDERSSPTLIDPRVAERAAITRGMHREEFPGVHEALVALALRVAVARRPEELLLDLVHR